MQVLVIGMAHPAARVAVALSHGNHTSITVHSVAEAAPGRTAGWDVAVIIPRMLKGATGIAALQELRRHTKAPVITIFDDIGVSEQERAIATTGGDRFVVWGPTCPTELLDALKSVGEKRGVPLYHAPVVLAAIKSRAAA